MRYSLVLSALVAAVTAITSPPSGAVTVAKSGGTYSTIQKAVDSGASVIFIQPGTYSEQVYIPEGHAALTIYGYSSSTDYKSNQVTITAGKSQDDGLNNDGTGTLRAHSDNFKLYNVNVVNSRGKGSQAIALSAYGDKQGYYGVSLQGFQDTVLSNDGHHLISKSQITGATDFIFGQRALLWVENSDIGVKAGGSYITANGRDADSNPSWYVINNSRVAAAPGESVSSGAFYLGRPWRNYARVTFQSSTLSNVVNKAGWSQWSAATPLTDHVSYTEYNNQGDGKWNSARASFAKQASSAVSISSILGSDYASWADKSYLPGAAAAANVSSEDTSSTDACTSE